MIYKTKLKVLLQQEMEVRMEHEVRQKLRQLGERILKNSSNELYLSMRFLDVPLSELSYELRMSSFYMGTDGSTIYYNPRFLIEKYTYDSVYVNRSYLHMLLHSIFRHMYLREERDEEKWNLACDIAVEYIIDELDNKATKRLVSSRREELYERLSKELKVFTAEGIYHLLQINWFTEREIVQYSAEYLVCDHQFWNFGISSNKGKDSEDSNQKEETDPSQRNEQTNSKNSKEQLRENQTEGQDEKEQEDKDKEDKEQENKEQENKDQEDNELNNKDKEQQDKDLGSKDQGYKGDNETKDRGQENNKEEKSEVDKSKKDKINQGRNNQDRSNQNRNNQDRSNQNRNKVDNAREEYQSYDDRAVEELPIRDDNYRKAQENRWKDISEKLKTNLETYQANSPKATESLLKGIGAANREIYDYQTFLRKFAVYKERLQVDEDSFDYGFYTFGIEHYGNIPFLEPLEYKDEKRVEEIVIAIDTSGSCASSLIYRFLKETIRILKSTETFHDKFRIHVIQCDEEIKEHKILTNLMELNHYMEHFQVKGFGNTDFRPVFEYIKELQQIGQLKRLKGLLYFTDGYGTFPSKQPEYETAFLFVRNQYEEDRVPAWAMKVVLEEEQIEKMGE